MRSRRGGEIMLVCLVLLSFSTLIYVVMLAWLLGSTRFDIDVYKRVPST